MHATTAQWTWLAGRCTHGQSQVWGGFGLSPTRPQVTEKTQRKFANFLCFLKNYLRSSFIQPLGVLYVRNTNSVLKYSIFWLKMFIF